MYLLWLRVAAILYAAGCVAVFPAVLYNSLPWRKTCVHLGGMAFFFHFVSVVEMLVLAHRWMPVGVREIESLLGFAVAGLFFLVWWLYDAISLGIFALPATFFLVFIPALGPDTLPLSLARSADELARGPHHRAAAGLRGALLQPAGVSALSGAGAAHQDPSPSRARRSGGRRSNGCRRSTRWSALPWRRSNSAFPA